MAFPVVEGTANSIESGGTNSHDVSLPASIASGELLIVVFAERFNRSATYPEGWTKMDEVIGSDISLSGAWRKADGTEGATITVTTDGSGQRSAHQSFRISGAADPDTTPPELVIGSHTVTSSPDPPSNSPAWGSDDNFWLAIAGSVQAREITTAPTNYTDFSFNQTGTSGNLMVGIATARRENATGTEDPDAFTVESSGGTLAATLAVSPAAAGTTDRIGQVTWAELETGDAGRTAQVTWAEMETADAPRTAQVTWSELEIPRAPRTGLVTWAEMEVPSGPRLAQVTWTELEVPPDPRRIAQVTWAEFETADAGRGARVSWAEMETLDAARRALATWAELEIGPAGRQGQVSWAEFEAPDAPVTDRQGQVTWAEMETGEAARTALVTWAELEVGSPDRMGVVTWAEFEGPDAPRAAAVTWAEFEVIDNSEKILYSQFRQRNRELFLPHPSVLQPGIPTSIWLDENARAVGVHPETARAMLEAFPHDLIEVDE